MKPRDSIATISSGRWRTTARPADRPPRAAPRRRPSAASGRGTGCPAWGSRGRRGRARAAARSRGVAVGAGAHTGPLRQLGEEAHRVPGNLPGSHLEMQVGPGRAPALPDQRDAIAGAHRLPLRDQQHGVVRVDGQQIAGVLEARPGCRSRECRCPRRRPARRRPRTPACRSAPADRCPRAGAPRACRTASRRGSRPVASGQRSGARRGGDRRRRRRVRAVAAAGAAGAASRARRSDARARASAASARPLISRMSSAGTPARARDRRPASRRARPRTSVPGGLSGCMRRRAPAVAAGGQPSASAASASAASAQAQAAGAPPPTPKRPRRST